MNRQWLFQPPGRFHRKYIDYIFSFRSLFQDGNTFSIQWIGLRANLQESPMILMGKSMVSGLDFPLNQSIERFKLIVPSDLKVKIGSVKHPAIGAIGVDKLKP